MPRTALVRPNLEILEDRFSPSVNEQFISGTLILSGTPNNALSITRVAGANLALQVTDGAAKLGTFNVTGDLRLNLTRYGNNITIDLAGAVANGTLGGNINLNLGRGNTAAVAGTNSITISGGNVGGSVGIQGGSGNESIFIGSADAVPGTKATLNVGSNVTANEAHGNGLGNTLTIRGGCVVGGNVILNGVDSPTVGGFGKNSAARVGGSVFASDAGSSAQALGFILTGKSTIGSGVSLQGTDGNGNGGGGDLVEIDAGTVVGGGLSANLGNGLNTTLLDGTVKGTASISGGNGTTATAGIPVNLIEMSGTVGNLNINLGNADSSVPGSFGNDFAFSPAGTVLGNLNITMGNGSNTLDGDDLGLTKFGGTVGGNVNINLGNGTNKFTFAGVVGGPTVSYTGGHGANSVTLDTAPGNTNTFAFNVRLGAGGLNTVTYTAAATAGSALIDFGASGPNNAFISAATITWPNTILNY